MIDFEVHHGDRHHGNATQEVAEHDPELYFVSTHQPPIFPNTGVASERSAGNVLNSPLARGWGGAEFRRVFRDRVLRGAAGVDARGGLRAPRHKARRAVALGL